MSGARLTMTLSEAARRLDGRLLGPDETFGAVSSDSRSLPGGALFVALRGPRFDGHDFVAQACTAGARAALVERELNVPLPQIVVPDTRLALGRLAAAWRARSAVRLVAVTGSNGKTTVKEMLAAILGCAGPTLATEGNLNNDIGMPLTLLRLQGAHRYAVIEMGANHPGEIGYLAGLARPDVALITNAGAAHLEGFGSLDGVARAKGEIYAGLGEDGVAVINADDAYAGLWRELAGVRRCLSFGLKADADVSARWRAHALGSTIELRTPQGEAGVELQLAGEHNVLNALAATAGALAAGADLAQVRQGLEAMRPVKGRLQPRAAINGARIIDDTYNANPGSLRAALRALGALGGERYLALGDMAELGELAAESHFAAGREAHEAGIERLYATGPLSRYAVDGFGESARHFAEQAALIEALRADLHAGVTLLVKGSRASRMERVVEALAAPGEG